MKRLIISITIIVLVVLSAQASRALTEPVTISQPDGTTVTIILNGDVHCNWLTTTDGMMLVEINKGYYVATIDDSGKLQATRQLAHNAQQRLATEQQLFQEQQSRKALFFDRAKKLQQQGRRAQIANSDYFPHMGQPKTLVILANFSDVKFTSDTPQRLFEQYFNGETTEGLAQNGDKNLTTVHRYFELCSHGKFNPQFVVVGPVDLPQTMEYYGASEEGSSDDANFSQFCNDVISAVDNEVNFNDYDNDGDGKAELVCVVYAGYGQNISGNPANSIWPKCSYRGITTTDTYAKDNSQNVTVSYMNCCAELFRMNNDTDLNGIGTFVHEFSHGMGLPDLYATVSSAQINNQTPEFWDLMDYGEHANNGYAPVPYTAWEQETMGWIEVETLTNTQNVTDMLPLLQGGKAYKFGNGSNSEEWMYLENVQSRDATNKIPGYAYGHGLLVSHVAYNKSTVSMGDYPNNTAGTPLISIVPADGLVINGYQFGDGKPYTQEQYTNSLRGDTYPGTSTITTLSDSQNLPNYKFYSGDSTPHFCLKNIAEDTSTGAVSFDFDNDSQPYARLENDELVFMYDGNKTDNDFAITTFNSPEDRAWHQSASSIKSVRIAESFIDYTPTSTAFWFYGMEMLEALDLSSLTMTNVTNTSGMFTNCSSLTTITVNNTWPAQNGAEGTITPDGSGSNVTGSDMFNGCRSLKGGAGTTYDASHVDYAYAHIDVGESNPGYFTDKNAVASNLEIYSVDKSVTYVANQSINPTQSIIMTPGNDSEWKTDLAIGLTNTTTGESNDPLEFKASIYYPNSTVTFSFLPAMRGTLNPRDGNLTYNADTGEVENTGSAYVPGYKNLPKSGSYIVYEALQNGSLIIPIRVTADKSLFVVTGDGNPVVDIQFKDSTGTTQVLNAEPLCSVASEYVMGFVSFNVEKGQKYYVFCNASNPRIAGYIFSTEAITIDQETMKNVRDILQPAPIQDMELFAVDATTAVTPNEPIQVTRSVTMTPGEDSAWGVRLLENSTTSYEFDASKYYPTSTSKYTFWGSTRGTNSAKDGALTEGISTGQTYNYTLKNSPQSGAYMTFEASQNGSLIIPLHVPLNKPLYVLDGNGKAKTDIQFINLLGQAVPMLAEPLCMFSETETTSGFLSFNVNQGEKYTIFINDGADLRFGGYVFSPESITIDPATMANVKSILDAEPYAAFNNDSTVLTFYYDDQKPIRKGMSVGPFSIPGDRGWESAAASVTTVVFDQSMANCTSLTSTAHWFYGFQALTTIRNIGYLKTDNVTDMQYMFYDCNLLTNIELAGFNTANVTNMRGLFYKCQQLQAIDLSNFNTAKVTDVSWMFYGCNAVTTIYAGSSWTLPERLVDEDGAMFNNCTNLKGGAGTTYDANHIDHAYAHIDGGESNPGYFTDKNAPAANPEPYVVLSENNTVMTFFYDDQKAAKGGMDVGPFDYYSKDKRGWSPYTSQITKAVFDQSFDQCTTLTSTAFWFTYMTQLETIEHIEYLHTDNVEDMNCMFDSCYVLRDLDVSHFVTAKVKDMQCMFNRCEALTSLNLSNFNTSSCTFMRGMFYDCKGLTSLDLSSFNTSNNTSTEYMFQLCSSLENIIFGSGFSTENVTNMRGMFDGCSSLKSLNVGGFNTQKVSLMSIMFRGCSSLTSLDVSSFNTANVTDMVGMFMQCSGLTSLDLSKFNTEKVTNMSYMFNECSQLTSPNLSSFNTANVVNMRAMFQLCSSLTSLDLSNFNTQNVTDMSYMFSTCSGLTNPNMKSFNTSNVTEMYAMFALCSALTTLDMSSFSTANVTDMGYMFEGCSSLASIQAGNAVIADSIYAQIENPNLLLYVNEASQTPQSVRNVVVLDVAEQIVLTDTVGNNNFFCPKQFTAKRISYTHNYKQATQVGVSRGWETIALPFSVQTITHEKNGTLVPFGVDGGKPFWLRELTENGLVSAQRIEAYVPYLISMPNNSIYPADYNQAGNVTFSATDAVVPVTEQRSASGNNRTLIPTCQRVGQSASVYAINLNAAYESNAEGSIFVANYREVRPFEAYVEHPNGGARYYTLGDLADMDVTGLQAIHNIVASDFVKVYNLSGALVKSGKHHEVIPYLTKGVYIINGSKVVIK